VAAHDQSHQEGQVIVYKTAEDTECHAFQKRFPRNGNGEIGKTIDQMMQPLSNSPFFEGTAPSREDGLGSQDVRPRRSGRMRPILALDRTDWQILTPNRLDDR
jgi:hypothetical protein